MEDVYLWDIIIDNAFKDFSLEYCWWCYWNTLLWDFNTYDAFKDVSSWILLVMLTFEISLFMTLLPLEYWNVYFWDIIITFKDVTPGILWVMFTLGILLLSMHFKDLTSGILLKMFPFEILLLKMLSKMLLLEYCWRCYRRY